MPETRTVFVTLEFTIDDELDVDTLAGALMDSLCHQEAGVPLSLYESCDGYTTKENA